MKRVRRLTPFVLLALTIAAIGLFTPRPAAAEPNLKTALVSLAPVTGTRNIELAAQIFDVSVAESGDNTVLSGQLTFRLHNTDKLTPAVAILGFPAWGGGVTEFNERTFSQYAVTLDGEAQTLQPLMQNLRIGNESRSVRWLTFPITLTEDDRATVDVRFRQDLGSGALPSIVIAQAPAINWKGYVGSARFTLRFPALTTPEQFRVLSPPGSDFDGRSLTWLYSEYNPDAPIVLQVIKPRIWRELTQARTALAQGNDAKAALTLGAQFTLLARASLSGADFAQAVAAYQHVSEPDPLAATAALEAARLYEGRLRGEFGAVADANAARTAALQEWQKALRFAPTNAEARDAVAQHAFTLAQSLRRGGQFAGALSLLEAARSANSGKINRAQLDAETRANNAGTLAQLMDAGNWEEALRQIQAGAIGAEARNERSTFQPAFVGVQAAATIDANGQTVVARLAPFPRASPAHEQMLSGWLERAKGLGAAGELAPEGAGYALTLRSKLPLGGATDLATPPELMLLRETISPSNLVVTRTEELFTSIDAFRAQYSFVNSQREALAKAAEIERALAPLASPAADDGAELVRAVRVRALEQYRAGWQSLAVSTGARITWQREVGAPEQWDVRVGELRALESRRTDYNAPAMLGVICLVSAGVLLVAVGGWLMLRRPWRNRLST